MPKQAKASKAGKPQEPPKPRSGEEEMADTFYRAAQQPQPERIQDVLARRRSATTAPVRSSGLLLLSERQEKKAKAFYRRKLDKTKQAKPIGAKKEDDPKFWRNQKSAAMHITTVVLKLNVGSWQTVKARIVKPVLLEWKAAQQQIEPPEK